VKKLVAGPDVYVCDGCIGKAERAVAKGTSTAFEVVRKTGKAKCSFCGLKSGASRAVVASVHAAVCTDCLTMCRQIMSSRAT
jgi:ATP-dependent protease Clp ATPase subunit